MRLGLETMIAGEPSLELMASVRTLPELAQNNRYREADDIVADATALNDRIDQAALFQRIGEWLPGMRVLFIGSDEDARQIRPENLPGYMNLDAVGFIAKVGSSERLIQAIRLVAARAFVCEEDIITRLNKWANDGATPPPGQLSEREVDVLELVAQGRSNREIAEELFVSEGTVKIHVSHIMSKLDLDRRIGLVRYALASGIAALD